MQILDDSGIVDLPVIIILCIILASLAIGLGLKGFERFGRLRRRQNSIRNFDRLVEAATEVAYGGIEGNQKIHLNLDGWRIMVDGKLVQLRSDEEILKSEFLPLPLRKERKEKFTIYGGEFSISLQSPDSDFGKNENPLFLKLSELPS